MSNINTQIPFICHAVRTMIYIITVATEGEDYVSVDMNITFTSGQNASGDNQQCFSVTILNDDLLECNETFDIIISAVSEDEDVVNVTGQVITVTIEEDPNDCKFDTILFIL